MPEVKEVTARSPKLDRDTTVFVSFGEDCDESVEMFGGEAVNSNAFANGVVTVQAGIRSGHKTGMTDDQIQEKYKDWKLGVAIAKSGGDPVQAFLAKFKLATGEEQAAYLEQLRESASMGDE